jgi:tRNA(Ile)-lysidine synthetase-like protein
LGVYFARDTMSAMDARLSAAIAPIPPGKWVVAVSGGADSVALLLLLHSRPDLVLHVAHLNHQTRGPQSDADESFVADLARRLSLPCSIARRDEIEPAAEDLPSNRSARYRALRMIFFRQVCRDSQGVILAHHADDQAETILLRLLRGSGPAGLAGMSPRRKIAGLLLLRPLLSVGRDPLRQFLQQSGQPWREDPSNSSDQYARNRARLWLLDRPQLVNPLLDLGSACAKLNQWIAATAPRLDQNFPALKLAELPRLLARHSARNWLCRQGSPPSSLTPRVLDRLLDMARDAATPARCEFPGNVRVQRRGGRIATRLPASRPS